MQHEPQRRPVERRFDVVGQVDQSLHLRRDEVDVGRLVVVDEPQHPGAVVLVLHHRGRTGEHREERVRPLRRVIERPAQHGASGTARLFGESGADQLPDRRIRTLGHVAQRPANALRVAGGAARVEHRPAEALVLRLVGRAGRDEVVEVLEPVVARRPDHECQSDVGAALVAERLGDFVDELVADDHRLRIGVAEDVGDLARDEVPVDGDEDDARVGARERGLEPLVAVAADDCDRVAGPDAGVTKAVDQAVDALVELGPGAGPGVVGEGELVALLGGESGGEDSHRRSGPRVLERCGQVGWARRIG